MVLGSWSRPTLAQAPFRGGSFPVFRRAVGPGGVQLVVGEEPDTTGPTVVVPGVDRHGELPWVRQVGEVRQGDDDHPTDVAASDTLFAVGGLRPPAGPKHPATACSAVGEGHFDLPVLPPPQRIVVRWHPRRVNRLCIGICLDCPKGVPAKPACGPLRTGPGVHRRGRALSGSRGAANGLAKLTQGPEEGGCLRPKQAEGRTGSSRLMQGVPLPMDTVWLLVLPLRPTNGGLGSRGRLRRISAADGVGVRAVGAGRRVAVCSCSRPVR